MLLRIFKMEYFDQLNKLVLTVINYVWKDEQSSRGATS